jgi:hypothetical protein
MKKLAALLAMLSLLSLMPAAFAADGDVAAPRPGDNGVVRRADKDVSRHQTSQPPRSDDQTITRVSCASPGCIWVPMVCTTMSLWPRIHAKDSISNYCSRNADLPAGRSRPHQKTVSPSFGR